MKTEAIILANKPKRKKEEGKNKILRMKFRTDVSN